MRKALLERFHWNDNTMGTYPWFKSCNIISSANEYVNIIYLNCRERYEDSSSQLCILYGLWEWQGQYKAITVDLPYIYDIFYTRSPVLILLSEILCPRKWQGKIECNNLVYE